MREDITVIGKISLDLTWLKDKSFADLDNLPDPDDMALEIVEESGGGVGKFQKYN